MTVIPPYAIIPICAGLFRDLCHGRISRLSQGGERRERQRNRAGQGGGRQADPPGPHQAQRRAARVYLGCDADPRLTEPLRAMCALAQVPVIDDMTMADLGKACGIAVGTAACAVLSE